jgi:hypothetical protein
MTKNYRQGQILKLIRTKRITTQDELARELRADGIEATQVTLSRDIRELGLAKTADGYREILADSAGAELATVITEFLLDVRLEPRGAEDVSGQRQLAGSRAGLGGVARSGGHRRGRRHHLPGLLGRAARESRAGTAAGVCESVAAKAVHYLMATTIESGPTRCSTRVSRNPACFIQPEQSAPV